MVPSRVWRLRPTDQLDLRKALKLLPALLGQDEQFGSIGNLKTTPRRGPPSTTQRRNHEIDWKFKSHVALIPKYRKAEIFAQIRKELGNVFLRLARQFVSTVGRDEQAIREYVLHQEAEDRRIGPLSLI